MFKTRVLSSIFLVIMALVTIFCGGYLLTAILLFISMVAYKELSKACGIHTEGKHINALEGTGYLGILCYYGAVVFAEEAVLSFLCVLFVLIASMFVYVFTFPRFRAEQVMAAFFSFVYAPVMISFILQTRQMERGIYIVWMIFISSWICDSCAYLTGIKIGKHKLTPNLSPKKSIEGAIGGIVGSAVVGGLYGYFITEKMSSEQDMIWIFVLISSVGAIVSQIGDLAASAIKRNHGIKDYGNLIPGHGGIMDRFDSVIFTAPMIYALAVLLIE